MTWTPQFAATDVRAIVGNLLTFFETNQVAALAWASPSRPLTALTKFYRTAEVEITKDFPHFGIIDRGISTDDADSGLIIEYQLTFLIEGPPATHTLLTRPAVLAQLQVDIDNYAYAIESMFLNIPHSTLFASINGVMPAYKSLKSSKPLERAIGETQSLFVSVMTAVLRFTELPVNR